MTWIMLIFVIIAIVFVGRLIRSEDQKSQLAQLHQHTELRADAFNMRISSDAERVSQLMSGLHRNDVLDSDISELRTRARSLMASRSEILEIFFLKYDGTVLGSFASPTPLGDLSVDKGQKYDRLETTLAIQRSHRNDSVSFSEPYALPLEGSPFVDLVIPYRWNHDEIIVAARISLWMLLRETTKGLDSNQFRISLLHNDLPIVSATTDSKRKTITYQVPLHPLPQGVNLQVSSYAHGLITQNVLFWVISALGIFLVLTLVGLIRFNIRQNHIETALRAETALRKAMADSQLSGLRVTDMNGRIVYANQTFCRMLKYDSSADLIGQMPPYSYWPTGDVSYRLKELSDALIQGRLASTTYEFSPVCADGSRFYALLHVTPLRDTEGKQLGWLGSLTDISEIQQAQEKLTAAHERFTRVLESMQSAISVVDQHTNTLLFSNTSYDTHFGENNEGHLMINRALNGQDASQGMFVDVYVEEADQWYAVQEKIITWTDRSAVRLQIALDITERRRNEMLLAEQQARSEQNSRLVTMGEMASSLAHELNQPLAAISNYSFIVKSLMKKVGVPTEHEMFHSVERIDAQAERAAGIIRRIRSFTKRSDPNMELNSVDHLVDEVLELARLQARRHNAKLEHFIAPDVKEVWCDAIMIEQVLLNLIKNGIEASVLPGQTSSVTMTIYRDAQQNVVFEVADNGSGIADEDKERLFDPFFTTKSSGMGMGLNICRTIVELHHGRLTISDNIKKGTIFTLTLPTKEFVQR
ncbi:MAG: PAS domain S-box protein [Burkholderiaceae bacterium]|nr:PAS domain S-box protein [Burkholderiaceae bacterium]